MTAHRFNLARVSLTGDRSSNQDRCASFYVGNTVLLALGDGLGGHPRGDVAARLFMDVCENQFRRSGGDIDDPAEFMLDCLQRAHESINSFGERQAPPITPRTTAVLAIVQRGVAHWCHAGDSRVYLIRDGHAMAQTRDHTQMQYIHSQQQNKSGLRSSITRCLGGSKLPLVTAGPSTRLEPGDRLLLCSDGFWGQHVPAYLIRELGGGRLDRTLKRLAREAVSNAAPHSDNVSAICMQWNGGSGDNDSEADSDVALHAAIRTLRNFVRRT